MLRYGLFVIAVYTALVAPSPCDGACRGRLFNRPAVIRKSRNTGQCPATCKDCLQVQPARQAVHVLTSPVRALAPVCGAGGCCR